MADLSVSSIVALSSVCGFFGILISCSIIAYCHRRYVYGKRNGTRVVRAVPSAYIPPDAGYKYIIPPDSYHIPNGSPGGREILIENEKLREDNNNDVTKPESPPEQTQTEQTEQKDNPDLPKSNGYVKNSRNRKSSEHIVTKEHSNKLYDPEHVVLNRSYIQSEAPEVISRPRSYIHYEPRRTEYIVRGEKGYKKHKKRAPQPPHTAQTARRVAYTYGTWRRQPEVISPRPMQVHPGRSVSEIATAQPRIVRVIRPVPQTARSVRAHTLERPVVVRRSVSPERVLTTPQHGFIPRHTLGRYKPKVIDGYVAAPSNIRERVVYDTQFSDQGEYREVLLEPMYHTRPTIPPPAYEGEMWFEKEKVPVEKIEAEETVTKRYSANLEEKPHILKTDDEKLNDIPLTQYFDDGKTIMIIDYLVDPYVKVNKPQSTSTPRYQHQNGDVVVENGHDSDSDEDELNTSHARQRPAPYGDVNFLP